MLKIVHPPHDYILVLHALQLTSLADRRVIANLDFLGNLIDDSINAASLLAQLILKFRIVPQGLEFLFPYLSIPPIMVELNQLTA